ncbi:HAD hydrolase-like protein [Arthrobacter sp. H14-L1]|uniref:HAD hydrolase-like protein n=1 Tax=Arthrobacter sp. H14-L1 TaxID=2996697 RepID=UPI00226EEDF6|nr:HAD hydrolase-like protein [Arthrobacter sp. H14-L1]
MNIAAPVAPDDDTIPAKPQARPLSGSVAPGTGLFDAILFDAVLFDLDGTLVDPAGGITGGIAHALQALGLPTLEPAELEKMVGPKLSDALVSIAGVPEPLVGEVIATYRAWYAGEGMAMSRVYPGIGELLTKLRAAGLQLAVATQKPEPLAHTLLTHHGLADSFDLICGSHADETLMPFEPGYRADKTGVIAAALEGLEGHASPHSTARRTIMVGDRHQDVYGARANGLDCIGVSWGFAPEGELAAAGVAEVVHSCTELGRALGLAPAGTGAVGSFGFAPARSGSD